MDVRSDEDLLAATAAGEPAAFAAFYRRHAQPLTGFFVARTRNPELAADLTAETFAAALEGCGRFAPARGSAPGWLYGIAHHELAQLARRGAVDRRARRRLGMPRIELSDEQLERIEALAAVQPLAAVVAEGLAALPAEQRAAVQGRIVEERGYGELAAAAAVSETVVRQRVSRGLAALRARLQKEQP
jgi:RNA polymerase sigma-70 factor (ECF subfamily)